MSQSDTVSLTADGDHPFWSADNRFVGQFAAGKLRKIDIFGGPAQPIADAPLGRGGSWNADDIILFAPDVSGPLFRVPAGGSKPENSAIYLAALDSSGRTFLMHSSVKASFLAPNYILFVRDATLMAQSFDPARGQLNGDPFPVTDGIGANTNNGASGVSSSANGLLAQRTFGGGRIPETSLTWFDRAGKELGTLGPPGPYRNPRISPDGSRVVVERGDAAGQSVDLWLIDVARQVPTRFTFARPNGSNSAPAWSSDGTRIAWLSRTGPGSPSTFMSKLSSGTGNDEILRQIPGSIVIDDWVRDRGILFHASGLNPRGAGLRLLPVPEGEPQLLGEARALLTRARVSPDGKWVAFASSVTGRLEIYLQNFPTPAERIQVFAAGGIQPEWRPDGKELFYLAPDGKLMAVTVELSRRTSVGSPVPLFATRVEGGGILSLGIWHQYDVTPDGRRFLVNATTQQETETAPPITILVNWAAGLLTQKGRD